MEERILEILGSYSIGTWWTKEIKEWCKGLLEVPSFLNVWRVHLEQSSFQNVIVEGAPSDTMDKQLLWLRNIGQKVCWLTWWLSATLCLQGPWLLASDPSCSALGSRWLPRMGIGLSIPLSSWPTMLNFLKKYLFTLAVPGLICGTWDLCFNMWDL